MSTQKRPPWPKKPDILPDHPRYDAKWAAYGEAVEHAALARLREAKE